ncbi:lipopolysaccharide transport periplasmic protein LptA [Candidatus Thioglobus sp.]|uniref:lipopolysaccharide transport periplasmic protein LptA n=1 Tax=Candidatus Thioglobus sp. TaxID=2026721 RepID=UPI003D0DD260
MNRSLFLLIFLLPNFVGALPIDKAQPIHVKAQAVAVDEKKGYSIYTGSASVTQGLLALSAEKIQIFNDQNSATKIIAEGDEKNRAHYQQTKLGQQIPIEADANNITYLIKIEELHLKDNASVIQGLLSLSAETIKIFNKQTEVNKIIAQGDKKNRARYQQIKSNQSSSIEATAQNITYLIKTQMLYLKGNALLVQGTDSFSGATLDYDIKNDKVVVKKSKDGKQRVRFKIKL